MSSIGPPLQLCGEAALLLNREGGGRGGERIKMAVNLLQVGQHFTLSACATLKNLQQLCSLHLSQRGGKLIAYY